MHPLLTTHRFFSGFLLTLGIVMACARPAVAQGNKGSSEPIKAAQSIAVDESLEAFPGFRKFYKNSQLTIVPVPVFSTMPDEGQTYGLMPTFLITNTSGKTMKTVISPMVGYNTIIKTMGGATVLFYPSKNTTVSLYAGGAQKFYQEYEIIVNNEKALDGKAFISAYSRFYNDPYGRFFGLGPTSAKSAKSYYTATTFLTHLTVGYNFTPRFRFGITERYYYENLKDPLGGKVPNIISVYGPGTNVEDSKNLTSTLKLSFDSNMFYNPETPFSQTEANGSFVFSANGMGSKSSFSGVDVQAKETLSYGHMRRFSTVARLHVRRLFGGAIPFFEMPSLGGPNELRGYTAGRFVDKGLAILQLEQRNHIAHINFFNRAAGDLYIDPFFEVGQVFSSPSDFRWTTLQPTGGVGFRFQIPPGMLARVDVAFSREENFQVYTLLNYPF